MKKSNKLFAYFVLWNVLTLVLGEMDAEIIYKFLSGRMDDFSFATRTTLVNIDGRIKTVEENVNQLTSAIQQYTVNAKPVAPDQEAVVDFEEDISFQTLAVWKTLTKEKTLLRQSVKQVNTHFYQLRENIQKQMSEFFETVTNQLLAANNSIEVTSIEIVTLNDVVHKTSAYTRKDIEQLSSTIISESEDLRRGLEELKRDLKAEIEQIELELKSVLAKGLASCGQTKPSLTRIQQKTLEYDQDSLEHAWPFMAELHTGTEHRCGGSLIDNRWVLTAATCVEYYIPQVHLRKWKQTQREGHLVYHIGDCDIYIHPNFDRDTTPVYLYNIALIKLPESVEFDDTVSPVCLWNVELAESTGIDNSGFFGPGTLGVVTGWWSTDYMSYDIHDILQQTQVQIKSDEDCTAGLDYYERAQINLTQMFCAGGQVTIDGIQTNLDACTGSVGSPFIVENPVKRNTYIQTGIASFGFAYGCKQADKYGFFTRLTKELLNWIQDTMYKH